VWLLGWYEVGRVIYTTWGFYLLVCLRACVGPFVCDIVLFVSFQLLF
jgi:hypothetical protein